MLIRKLANEPRRFGCGAKRSSSPPGRFQIFRLRVLPEKLRPSLLRLEEFQERRHAEIPFRPNQQPMKMRLLLKPIHDRTQSIVCHREKRGKRSDIGNIIGNRTELLLDFADRDSRPAALEMLIQIFGAALDFQVDLAIRKAIAHSHLCQESGPRIVRHRVMLRGFLDRIEIAVTDAVATGAEVSAEIFSGQRRVRELGAADDFGE